MESISRQSFMLLPLPKQRNLIPSSRYVNEGTWYENNESTLNPSSFQHPLMKSLLLKPRRYSQYDIQYRRIVHFSFCHKDSQFCIIVHLDYRQTISPSSNASLITLLTLNFSTSDSISDLNTLSWPPNIHTSWALILFHQLASAPSGEL